MASATLLVTLLATRLHPQVRTAQSDRAWWVSGQANVIYQWHPTFHASYTGPNSLRSEAEHATSIVATMYTGLRIGPRTELLLDLESAGGGGVSQALGLAGFTNLDVVRNPTLGSRPYVARALVRHTIALSKETEPHNPELHGLLTNLPVRRLSLAVGKLSVADFFDVNGSGSDSHLQFLNWTVDNNGAYDYAADTRGYTLAAMIELRDRGWAVRWGEALMPTVANGIEYDWQLSEAHAENLELEVDYGLLPGHDGVIRLLGYVNHARMGRYSEALDAFTTGQDSVPDITAHRQPGRRKAGAGLNVEQEVGRGLHVFARAGLNDGRIESFAYTEVDRAVEVGAVWTSPPWRRRDRLGVVLSTNGLDAPHRDYLARGGLGFLLGDSRLDYGLERIVEAYYTWSLTGALSLAVDVQRIGNPGYNRARGPVTMFALRAHVDLPAPAP